MREGTIVRWLKSEGTEVALGEAIAEIETDKAVVELESIAAGTLRRILVSEGTVVPVGQPIAIITEADEELSEGAPDSAPPVETEIAEAIPDATASVPEEGPTGPVREVRASPIARRLAEEKGIDLTKITGTGPGDRITREDVLAYEVRLLTAPAPIPLGPSPPPAEEEAPTPPAARPPVEVASRPTPQQGEKVPLTRMRQQIARVTVRSKQETPHYYVTAEIDMTRAMDLRSQINEGLEQEGVHVSVNDMILKASVGALKMYPKFNAYFAGDGVQMNDTVNIGIAIAVEEGLILPAVLDCGSRSLLDLARASKDLVERSKSGALRSQEYAGGTYSVSNLGMFDVSAFTAIIQPPQSAVLAVGTVARRPVVRSDQVVVADVMTATLSADHRVSDGAEGARFLAEVKRLLENPMMLLM